MVSLEGLTEEAEGTTHLGCSFIMQEPYILPRKQSPIRASLMATSLVESITMDPQAKQSLTRHPKQGDPNGHKPGRIGHQGPIPWCKQPGSLRELPVQGWMLAPPYPLSTTQHGMPFPSHIRSQCRHLAKVRRQIVCALVTLHDNIIFKWQKGILLHAFFSTWSKPPNVGDAQVTTLNKVSMLVVVPSQTKHLNK